MSNPGEFQRAASRFHGELDDLTPAEFEDAYYLHQSQPDAA